MKLTHENVRTVVLDCLFKEGEPTDKAVLVESAIQRLGFHPERLEANRENVRSMLSDLAPGFHEANGGGWSMLNMPMGKHGQEWGEQIDADALTALAIALGLAKFTLPRDMWMVLPGGMPYVTVLS